MAQRLTGLLALISRTGQLNHCLLQLLGHRVQTQGDQQLNRLDPSIHILHLRSNFRGDFADLHRAFDVLVSR